MIAPFDPVSAIAGGVLIGIAATFLLALSGRIAGVSGIFAESFAMNGTERGWRYAFLLGLVVAPLGIAAAGFTVPVPQMPSSWAVVIGGGLLVGIGTRLSGGCTSGHGVCGLSRLSPRSLAATLIFMATAIAVVAVVRHGLGA